MSQTPRDALAEERADRAVPSDQPLHARAESAATRIERIAAVMQAQRRQHIQQILAILDCFNSRNHDIHDGRQRRLGVFGELRRHRQGLGRLFRRDPKRSAPKIAGMAPLHPRDAGDPEEEQEAAAARDTCLALRWHRANIASTLPVVEEDEDMERLSELRHYIDALGHARAALVAYYDLPLTDVTVDDPYSEGLPPHLRDALS